MRNANFVDIKRIEERYEVPFDVMFRLQTDGGDLLAHRKHALVELSPYIMMETNDGKVFSCLKQELKPIPCKPNNQKIKKRYTRPSGTGYTTIVPYDSNLIKVGTKVVLRNGERDVVIGIDNRQPALVTTKTHGRMFLGSGKKYRTGVDMENDITGVYVTTKFKPTAQSQEVGIPIYFAQEEINVLDELIGWGVGGTGKQLDLVNAAWRKITKNANNTSDYRPNWLEGMLNIRS